MAGQQPERPHPTDGDSEGGLCYLHGTSLALPIRHRLVLRAFGEALLSSASGSGPRPEQLDTLVDGVGAHLQPVSRFQRTMLLWALDLVRWLPVLLLWSLGPFEGLSLEKRTALLERMARSRAVLLVIPLVAYKTLLCIHFFEDEGELRAMGYPGDERKRWLREIKARPIPRSSKGPGVDLELLGP